jgi:hypothetical protein
MDLVNPPTMFIHQKHAKVSLASHSQDGALVMNALQAAVLMKMAPQMGVFRSIR